MSEAQSIYLVVALDSDGSELVAACFSNRAAAESCMAALLDHQRNQPDTWLDDWSELFDAWLSACPIPEHWGYSEYKIDEFTVRARWPE